MTERLYYTDSTLVSFEAQVVARDEQATTLYLDRTAFYPTSGGQPHDLGTLNGIAVVEVVDEDERIAHRLAAPLYDAQVRGTVEWERRFDHMQQHTGQHLLSAVLAEQFGIDTVSFHLGGDVSTIDVTAKELDLATIEKAVNREVWANRAVTVAMEESPAGLRKASERSGVLRVVTIAGIDRSACGGTHVRGTAEVGFVQLRKVEKVRQSQRIEFVCGGRAVGRAREDYETLAGTAKLFSVGLEQVPASVGALQSRLASAEKALEKLRLETATRRGAEQYSTTEPDADGRRVWRTAVPELSAEAKAMAQGFTATGNSVAVLTAGATVLVATGPESGLDAGALFRELTAQAGGKGGGGKTLAQGSVGDVGVAATFLQERLG